jgi:toxin HigB-1
VIRSFRDKDTEAVWRRTYVKKLSPDLINAAESINDLRVPPGNRLEKLVGARAGQYSIRVNDQWRVCFTWSASGAANVELVDYH